LDVLDNIIMNRLKQEPPKGCTVVEGSTAVIAFGKFRSAKLATVSLNPSYREFDLVNGKQRFHNLESLGVIKYDELDEMHKKLILDYCERYFERPGIVYKNWFNSLATLIKETTNFDYYNGTACHLDLSQWATLDIWGKLKPWQRIELLSTGDLELLVEIIKHSQIHTLLLNGKTTSNEIFKHLKIKPSKITLRLDDKVEGYIAKTDEILGVKMEKTINLVGWNVYLQRKGKVEVLSEWVKEVMKDL
jgi:hypothetical protein